MKSFAVSDVERGQGRWTPITPIESLSAWVSRPFEAAACNLPNLADVWSVRSRQAREAEERGMPNMAAPHALILAADNAFALHHPLILSPDDVWLCLAQGFATHVNLHAEALRDRFVQQKEKTRIKIRRDDFERRSPANDWPGVFAEFSERLSEHIGPTRDLIVADFSTTGPIERSVSQVVLFDAVKSYFDFTVRTVCGIPEITLLGTAEDWLSIRSRAERFAEFGLTDWTAALLPVLDVIVRAVQGDVDHVFWQSFYKWKGESGGPYVNGWINVLFPYLQGSFGENAAPCRNDFATAWERGLDDTFGGGPNVDDFPTGLATAPFTWKYLWDEISMEIVAGFVGVTQEPDTGALRPAMGWAVGEAET